MTTIRKAGLTLVVVGICAVPILLNHRFHSNVSFDELPDYRADFRVEGSNLVVELVNLPGLYIYELDHRVSGDSVIVSAHRTSSGQNGSDTHIIPIPPHVDQFRWLSPDSTTTPFNPRNP